MREDGVAGMTEDELRLIRDRAWWKGAICGTLAILTIFIVGFGVGPML